ncbi:hypothetical protein BDW66DRAFT_126979 [Aspergillus desertorum]
MTSCTTIIVGQDRKSIHEEGFKECTQERTVGSPDLTTSTPYAENLPQRLVNPKRPDSAYGGFSIPLGPPLHILAPAWLKSMYLKKSSHYAGW